MYLLLKIVVLIELNRNEYSDIMALLRINSKMYKTHVIYAKPEIIITRTYIFTSITTNLCPHHTVPTTTKPFITMAKLDSTL